MKLMSKLPALTLAAAIVPALALSTTVFAEDRSGMEADAEQRGGEQGAYGESAGEQRAGDRLAGEQDAGEQYLSAKPEGSFYSDEMIGKTVKHRGSDEDVGEISDLVIGDDGRIVGVVVTTGTFLGLGGQEVGLGWDQIEHSMEDDESVFFVDMDEETLRNAPEHKRE